METIQPKTKLYTLTCESCGESEDYTCTEENIPQLCAFCDDGWLSAEEQN